jgi:hypothetical protein
MRTTLTLDDDVAVQVERLRRDYGMSLRDVVNEALRRGLLDMRQPKKRAKPFRTEPIDVGEVLLPNVDNVAEVISLIECETHK